MDLANSSTLGFVPLLNNMKLYICSNFNLRLPLETNGVYYYIWIDMQRHVYHG